MRKIFLILLFLALTATAEAQSRQMITQFLPHVVAGVFPHSEWDSILEVKNSSSDPAVVVIEFFDTTGRKIAMVTDRGVFDRFELALASFGSTQLHILRQGGPFVTAWARVQSATPFSVFLTFREFAPGAQEHFAEAKVFSAPPDLVNTFDLKPENGIALVNPSSGDAKVTVTALNENGIKVGEQRFILKKGQQFAAFCNQPPFSFGNAKGQMVVASSVPLSGIGLSFSGFKFSTLPPLQTPRQVDFVKFVDNKSVERIFSIGAIYAYSPDREPQKDLAERIGEGFALFENLMRRELKLNGAMQNIPELPIDRDENGLPKVLVVKLSKPREAYGNLNDISKDIYSQISPAWTDQVIYYDVWKDVGEKIEGVFGDFSISVRGANQYESRAWLNAGRLPFLKASYFGNKKEIAGTNIPEFGNYVISEKFWSYLGEKTFEESSESAFHLFSHEVGHMLGIGPHASMSYLTPHTPKFKTIMGPVFGNGCYNPKNLEQQCVFSSVEASILARSFILNLNEYGWVEADRDGPEITILSKEWIGNRVKVTFSVTDAGIHSVWLESNLSPDMHFWKLLGHDDNLEEFTIEAEIPDWWQTLPPNWPSTKINIYAVDYHGNSTYTVNVF